MLKKEVSDSSDLRRLPMVTNQTGFSPASIYRLVKEGKFPAPIKIGARASAWIGSEVDSYIMARIAARGCK